MERLLDLDRELLPLIWDADFLLGPKTPSGEDTYVLCEINVSSVLPIPDEAFAPLADAAVAQVQALQQARVAGTNHTAGDHTGPEVADAASHSETGRCRYGSRSESLLATSDQACPSPDSTVRAERVRC
jgi:hypothetical protein